VLNDDRLWPAMAPLVPALGVAVDIDSDLPVGCGMGSSAALAVALVRALGARDGERLDPATWHRRAFGIERAFHGNPSGIDHAVSGLGGLVWYRREIEGGPAPQPPPSTRENHAPLALPGALAVPLSVPEPLHLAVINTGAPGNTAAMVAGVRDRRCHAELAEIGALVDTFGAKLGGREPRELGRLLDENQRLLQVIGVSTPALEDACSVLRRTGAWGAKLAGAGGGGVAFGLIPPDLEVPGAFHVVIGG
jgi:mevalonate kinase